MLRYTVVLIFALIMTAIAGAMTYKAIERLDLEIMRSERI